LTPTGGEHTLPLLHIKREKGVALYGWWHICGTGKFIDDSSSIAND
jgi:hypothetical protein